MSSHINSLKEGLAEKYIKILMQSSKKKINKPEGVPTDKYFFVVDDSNGPVTLSGEF